MRVRRAGQVVDTVLPAGTTAETVGWLADDGSRIAVYQGRDGRSDVLEVDAATGRTTVLSTDADGGLTGTGAVGALRTGRLRAPDGLGLPAQRPGAG